jgi:hypothetical protein
MHWLTDTKAFFPRIIIYQSTAITRIVDSVSIPDCTGDIIPDLIKYAFHTKNSARHTAVPRG